MGALEGVVEAEPVVATPALDRMPRLETGGLRAAAQGGGPQASRLPLGARLGSFGS
ncbi:MAG: hypothetical protein KY468_10180 [Armatimonadetes bacterium]|nr:hypothetical protein [Armatimonadota bacterium]